jgi:hypothetical protein
MAVVYDNFLSEEECEELLRLSTPLMEPAMLVNGKVNMHIRSKARTSYGAFFDSFETPLLAMITHRIAHVVKVPPGLLSNMRFSRQSQAFRRHDAGILQLT